MEKQMTIREIRTELFSTNKHTTHKDGTIMSNKESRDFFYTKDNQDELLKVTNYKTHLVIWDND